MPPKVPPPPHPDPLTLDQIFDGIVSKDSSSETRAYNIVALNTVAFHPTVKLFCFEYVRPEGENNSLSEEQIKLNRSRRESLIQMIAFSLSIRNNPVMRECRWEIVSLIGELCRMDNVSAKKNGNAISSASAALEEKLNEYAKENLEYLSKLGWFRKALIELAEATEDSADHGSPISSTGSKSREEMKMKLREKMAKHKEMGGPSLEDYWKETDEDVKIAMRDILRALPTVDENKTVHWTAENLEQAHDLMFLDASTSMAHLIPKVTRCLSKSCANCMKQCLANEEEADKQVFLRCSSCKSVFYCSAECQKKHWSLAHRTPCLAYKELCATILEQYYAANSKKKKEAQKKNGVDIFEVPLEPSLFFETRRYQYDHRDSSFSAVDFNDYFLKYTTRGN